MFGFSFVTSVFRVTGKMARPETFLRERQFTREPGTHAGSCTIAPRVFISLSTVFPNFNGFPFLFFPTMDAVELKGDHVESVS